MIAIAAMSENRVIGAGGKIPWHVSEDMKFFKRTTLGHVVLMGRKTYESMGKPLPGRENWVVSRSGEIPGVRMIRDLGEITEPTDGRKLFVIGGSQIYEQLLPRCSRSFSSPSSGVRSRATHSFRRSNTFFERARNCPRKRGDGSQALLPGKSRFSWQRGVRRLLAGSELLNE